MSEFESLDELVEELEVGDHLLWIGEEAMDGVGETAYPNKVKNIERDGDTIHVEGEGIQGGEYHFEVYEDGSSRAFFDNPNKAEPVDKGPVAVARRTDSDDPVPVVRIYDDLREDS